VRFAESVLSFGGSAGGADGPKAPPGEIWVAGDTWSTKMRTDANMLGNANIYEPSATNLSDPSVRLRDLDALGIDTQLLISSFFIGMELDNPLVEAALTRAYNRWAASLVVDRTDRFRWTVRPTLRSLDKALLELEFGAANGAAGVHLRGIEHGYYLNDPCLFPLYERAQDLDLAIIVHVGTAHRRVDYMPIGRVVASPPVFMEHIHKVMAGFHAVVSSDELHARFPRLRWGFVEGGATWVPAVLQQHARLAASGSAEFLHLHPITPDEIEAKNIFIACEADEDITYISRFVGENVLCIGSDYGHNDAGTELAAHTAIMSRRDISPEAARKIVDTNGRKLLGLPPAPPDESLLVDVPATLPHVRGAITGDGAPILSSVR
jgi:predicted TIM-barrel fold metal-dependent hydrolase